MLKTVLWISAACAAVLAALWFSRGVDLTSQPAKPAEKAPAAVEAAKPAAAKAPEPAIPEAKPPPTPDEQQVQDDAAATGMTTLEPEPEASPPAETPPPN